MPEMKSYLLVGLQFLFLGWIAFTGRVLASNIFFLVLELLGLALGTWAIITMRVGNLSVLPLVRPDAALTVRGPYNVIRHPMYTALLIATLAAVLDDLTMSRLLSWASLLTTLLIKLSYEEKLLAEHFAEYTTYRSRTWRLIPFLY
jgi:protein-S-isoprenylcysteine O-methyltransferase Ste14